MATRLLPAYQTFNTSNGSSPLAGGKIHFYVSGSVSTNKDTFSDDTLLTANTNPLILDSAGRVQVDVWGDNAYKMVVSDSADTPIATFDPVVGGAGVTKLLNIAALSALLKSGLTNGDEFDISGFTTQGDGGSGRYYWDASSTATADGEQVVITNEGGTGRWIRLNPIYFSTLQVGTGTVGSPQTHTGVQIQRDITAEGTSSHGFNIADYFAENLQALNPFGSDVKIGNGTQTTEAIDHVNTFQAGDATDLATGSIGQHLQFVAQSELSSGTITRAVGITLISELGLRDTPGFTNSNYEVNGTATISTEVGISTAIREHASVSYSAHFTGGATDAGANLTSGGAAIRVECPITSTQTTAASSPTVAAATFVGGIGTSNNFYAAGHINVNNTTATYNMNSSAGTNLAALKSTSTLTSLTNVFSGGLELGVSNAAVVRLQSDRFIPSADNVTNLGDASHRWSEVFAGNATINTSDERTKDNIQEIPDAVLDAWGDVKPVMFQLKDALKSKGDKARKHMGFIAQQVQAAFTDRGLDAFSYGLLCEDPQMHKVKKTRMIEVCETETVTVENVEYQMIDGRYTRVVTEEKREQPVILRKTLYNSDGSKYMKQNLYGELVEQVREYTPMKEIEEVYYEEELNGKTLMGLRYTECMVLHLAYLKRKINNLQNK
jgi:hypothetical protein